MSKNALPPEFVPVSLAVIKRLCVQVRSSLDDASCLCCWTDGFEYEVRQYISETAFKTFNAYATSLVKSLNEVNEICKSLDLSLDL